MPSHDKFLKKKKKKKKKNESNEQTKYDKMRINKD